MAKINAILASFTSLFFCFPISVFALNSTFPLAKLFEEGQEPTDHAERLRQVSKTLTKKLSAKNDDSKLLVIGRFTRTSHLPFLHELHFEDIQDRYGPSSTDTQMPNRIEYHYIGAYTFEGLRNVGTEFVPFSTKSVNVRVSIQDEHEGALSLLPATHTDVIGVLTSVSLGRATEATSSLCPTYVSIDAEQKADLLACYRSGECE